MLTNRLLSGFIASFHGQRCRSFSIKVTAGMVKELRVITGAPVVECKNALKDENVNGNVELAVEWLRKRGVALAAKKQDRNAEEGLVGLKAAFGDASSKLKSIVSLAELRSETDFVARNESFQNLLEQILSNGKSFSSSSDVLGQKLNDRETVGEAITQLTATVGEKVELKSIFSVEANEPNQIIGSYLHAKLSDYCGSMASVVVLQANDGDLSDEAKFQVQSVADDLALQVVGGGALFVDKISEDFIEKEREIETESIRKEMEEKNQGKVVEEEVLQKRVEKKVKKKLNNLDKEIVLMKQQMVTGEGSVSKKLSELSKEVKSKIVVKTAIKYQVGAENTKLE